MKISRTTQSVSQVNCQKDSHSVNLLSRLFDITMSKSKLSEKTNALGSNILQIIHESRSISNVVNYVVAHKTTELASDPNLSLVTV